MKRADAACEVKIVVDTIDAIVTAHEYGHFVTGTCPLHRLDGAREFAG